jgi:predicted nuclease with TOPRIM domain
VAALQSLGSVEGVLEDLADLKRQNTKLDDELKDMKDRYFNMSLRFAEVEAERGQLVMAVKALQSGKKLMPIRSANF